MRISLTALLMCIALAGCSPSEAPTTEGPEAQQEDVHDHTSVATHGGAIGEIGSHDALMEVVHDEDAGVLKVWVMDAAGAALAADEAPVLNIPADGKPVQVTGVEADGAWTFTDDALKGHPEGVRMRISVGGKPFNPELPHAH